MEVIESGTLGGQEDWQRIAEMIRTIIRRKLGETWWWSQKVQEKLKDKKKAKKTWDTIRNDASNLAYKTARKQAKREVAKARNTAYEKLFEKLETKERGKCGVQNSKAKKQTKQGCLTSKSNQE